MYSWISSISVFTKNSLHQFFFSIFNITSSTIISGCISSNLFSFTVMLKGKVSTISTSISSLFPYFQITKNWSFANVTSDSKGTIPFTLLLFDLPTTSGTDDWHQINFIFASITWVSFGSSFYYAILLKVFFSATSHLVSFLNYDIPQGKLSVIWSHIPLVQIHVLLFENYLTWGRLFILSVAHL